MRPKVSIEEDGRLRTTVEITNPKTSHFTSDDVTEELNNSNSSPRDSYSVVSHSSEGGVTPEKNVAEVTTTETTEIRSAMEYTVGESSLQQAPEEAFATSTASTVYECVAEKVMSKPDQQDEQHARPETQLTEVTETFPTELTKPMEETVTESTVSQFMEKAGPSELVEIFETVKEGQTKSPTSTEFFEMTTRDFEFVPSCRLTIRRHPRLSSLTMWLNASLYEETSLKRLH